MWTRVDGEVRAEVVDTAEAAVGEGPAAAVALAPKHPTATLLAGMAAMGFRAPQPGQAGRVGQRGRPESAAMPKVALSITSAPLRSATLCFKTTPPLAAMEATGA